MDKFRTGLLVGVLAGMSAAATVFAQFRAPPAGGVMNPPEAMSNAERRAALERCDALPFGPAKDRCMDELQANRNAAQANAGDLARSASRIGDGRTGAPGIGTGAASVEPELPATQGARSGY